MKNKKILVFSLFLIVILLVGCTTEELIDDNNYKLTVGAKVVGTGTVSTEPEKSIYNQGDEVLLTAKGSGDYTFSHWEGEGSGYDGKTDNPLKITITNDIQLLAVFVDDSEDDNNDDYQVNLGETVSVAAGTTSSDNGNLTLDYGLEVGKYEITHKEFIEFLNDVEVDSAGNYRNKKILLIGVEYNDIELAIDHNGSEFYFKSNDYADDERAAVYGVSWYGALSYANWLSEKENLNPAYDLSEWKLIREDISTLEGYRLATINEWDFVARGGANGDYTTYAGSNNIEEVGWYRDNAYDLGYSDSNSKTYDDYGIHRVGEKLPNELGIYDMSGNVAEFTNSYPSYGDQYIFIRGGSWKQDKLFCSVFVADEGNFNIKIPIRDDYGFRLVRTDIREDDNQAPVIEIDKDIDEMVVDLSGNVSDDGNLQEVLINWGDGNSDKIIENFSNITKSHRYYNDGDYTIEIIAMDTAEKSSTQDILVDINLSEPLNKDKMVNVRAGTAESDITDHNDITINYDFEAGITEVTFAEFLVFLNNSNVASDGNFSSKKVIEVENEYSPIKHNGTNFYFDDSVYIGDNIYVESIDSAVSYVSWYGALAYANWLSVEDDLEPAYNLTTWELKDDIENVEGYRLPEDYEWRYTARGGRNGNDTIYAGSDNIDEVAWYAENANYKLHPVGEKKANELGIYDMSGNVSEWIYTPEYDGEDTRRVLGGNYLHTADRCGLGILDLFSQLRSEGNDITGFRLVRTK